MTIDFLQTTICFLEFFRTFAPQNRLIPLEVGQFHHIQSVMKALYNANIKDVTCIGPASSALPEAIAQNRGVGRLYPISSVIHITDWSQAHPDTETMMALTCPCGMSKYLRGL